MSTFQTFDRDIRVATAGMSQEAISAELARFAKSELERAIASGEASRFYSRYVNGREGLPETAVNAPGPIVYVFSNWEPVIKEALAQLVQGSPRKSGRFSRSFIVVVSGRVVTDFASISPEAEVIITNFQPYVRKVQVGQMDMSVPPLLFNRARREVEAQFGRDLVSIAVRFLILPAGLHDLIPYILKGRSKSRRRDRRAGMPLAYPSLVMTMVD